MVGRDLDQFVVVDEFQRLFEAQADRRHQDDVLVRARGAHVGELLALHRVYHQVVVARVDADDHALVQLFARADEHAATVLQIENCVGHAGAEAVGDQHAVHTAGNLALFHRAVVVEGGVQQPGAGGGSEEFGAKTR